MIQAVSGMAWAIQRSSRSSAHLAAAGFGSHQQAAQVLDRLAGRQLVQSIPAGLPVSAS
jgi:hypothetical protein